MSVTIQINRTLVEAEPGEMLIRAADRAGIYIPRFCYHPKLSIAANCRMCLVEVASAPDAPSAQKCFAREEVQVLPKQLPACATPVTERMVVFTDSQAARDAQQGTLEFLLINHPLDCPVCDQGGECPLQDQAMGYGADDSRFHERKRAVASHDIGPLIATEMTRCIHCTRCVRFGEEIAGLMELGMPGRGEHAHIATYLNRSVDSEVSGNMIDLCPVGALTSKPYRFAARAWELQNHSGVSPHDCVGANLRVQTLRGRIERVLPRDNPQVNECWLADRDRYSYEALHHPERLRAPMVRHGGGWRRVSWESALQCAADGIRAALQSGGENFAALGGYASTLEEYYLLQKLTRALGGNHVDHRMQQCDFRDDAHAPPYPQSQVSPPQFARARAAVLVGSNLRKEQPLLALRLRAAVKNGAHVCALNPIAYEQNFAAHSVTTADALPAYFAALCMRAAERAEISPPKEIAQWARAVTLDADAKMQLDAAADALLSAGKNVVSGDGVSGSDGVDHSVGDGVTAGDSACGNAAAIIVLGALALQHPQAAVIRALAAWLCEKTGARLAPLPPGNSAAAWLAGCVPHRLPGGGAVDSPGQDARAMMAAKHRAYVLLGAEPELDSIDAHAAADALRGAEFVVRITAFRADENMAGNVLLPMATFAESAGTFVNFEGRAQQAHAAASPPGEARPAWKILRVLGNFLGVDGFAQVTLREVRAEISAQVKFADGAAHAHINESRGAWQIPPPPQTNGGDGDFARLLDMPMYRGDALVRHAAALQRTADNPPPAARVNAAQLAQLSLEDGGIAHVQSAHGETRLRLHADARVPPGCVYVPAGHHESAALGAHARVTLRAETKAGRA